MITLKNISLRRGTKVLLDQAQVSFNPGEKIGLVGRNGAGKSSVFALLDGSLHEDAGELQMPAQWRLAQVAQHMPETDQSATDFVVDGDTALVAARQSVQDAQNRNDNDALAHAYMNLQDAGAHDAQARAQALILGLGFRSTELVQAVNSFSGGWRMRLQLARALMCPSDLLLLDEPTNHLDLDAMVWLESWLRQYKGTMLVISHDREFLDAVTQVTVHIDNGKLMRYSGNYSQFEDLRAEQISLQQSAYARQQDKIAHLQKFIARFKAKASKARQAQSRVKALDRMEKIAPLLHQADFNFEFSAPANLPNPMLTMKDMSVGYPSGNAPDASPSVIVRAINRSVLPGQRIGILGANGQGKSTVVKTIAHDLTPLAGTITEGKGLSIGYFAQQELDVLRADETPLQHMTRLARDLTQASALSGQATREQDLRNFLGTFNFSGDMVKQAVGSMSGGEKARLVLCMLVWTRPNLLLLDEPTNHLDLTTREALALALNEFEGSVMLVSHDRALLRSVCDEFWLVSAGGLAPFDGDLEDYQTYLIEEAKRRREALRQQAAAAKPAACGLPAKDAPAQKRSPSASTLKRQIQALDQRIASLQNESKTLQHQLGSTTSPDEIAQHGRRLNEVQETLASLEEQWLELSIQLE